MESEAELFLWPNRGWDNEIVRTRARADSILRLLVTKTPFTLPVFSGLEGVRAYPMRPTKRCQQELHEQEMAYELSDVNPILSESQAMNSDRGISL
jgi:hypothetical protein